MTIDSRRLHLQNVALTATHWGAFDLHLEGTNTTGTPVSVVVRIEWSLWPMLAACAKLAWPAETKNRAGEMMCIEETLPRSTP